jgi:hypothetical protein
MLKVQVTKNSSGENVQVTANNRDKTRKSLEGLSAGTRLPAMPYPMNKGQEKGSGQPVMNRSKQVGYGY